MARTEIYFKRWCPYCQRALALLREKGVPFTAIDLTNDRNGREQEMRERAGRTSVPQVFIGGQHIGGYDDMAELDRDTRLDALLSATREENVA